MMDVRTQAPVRTTRRFGPLSLDRDALARFFERATVLIADGETSIEVRDGAGRSARFRTVDELAHAPHLPAHLTDVALAVVGRDGDSRAIALARAITDGAAALTAEGEPVWAAAAVSLVGDTIDVYATAHPLPQPPPMLPFGGYSAGFAVAAALAIAHVRGALPGALAAIVFALAWFALDFALAEIRLRFMGKPSPPLEIQLSGETATPRPNLGLWRTAQVAAFVAWLPLFYAVFAYFVPRLAKH